jgi:dipeptidyl aminopeptidase/acylaminoacyl peptidase
VSVSLPPRPPDLGDRPPEPEALIEEARRRARRRRQRDLVGLLAAVLGALWLYSLLGGSGPESGSAFLSESSPPSATPLKAALPEELSFNSEGGVWLVRRDGSRWRLADQVTATSSDGSLRFVSAMYSVEWSPDGSTLLAFRQSSAPALVLVDGTGNVSEPIAKRASVGSWSPDGTRIAFVRPERGAGYVIHVVSRNGGHVRWVATRGQFTGADPSFSWSPDGKRLVYAGRGNLRLFIANADGRGMPRPIRIGSGGDGRAPGKAIAHLQWSPDGSLIAFMTGPYEHVYVVRPDGTSLRRVADGYDFAWSPDSRRLAIVGPAGPTWGDVSVVRSDGTGLHRIARATCALRGASCQSIAWSPDGSRIAYISGRGNIVSTIRPDGSRATVVATQAPGGAQYPGWPLWRPRSTR